MKRWLVLLVIVSISVLGCAAATYVGMGPVADAWYTEKHLRPQAVQVLGPPADPLVILVGITWTEEGYCVGQFTVRVTESSTEIRVGDVTTRERRFGRGSGACAGVGTRNNMAWASARLASPVGDRAVIRDSDGARLPTVP